MAGVEFSKQGTSALGEMSVHFDNEIRGNSKINHSNINIDPSLTRLNYYIGVESYEEIVHKIEEKIKEADAINPPKRLRKDRKTWFSLDVPCPPELEGTLEEDKFFQMYFDLLKENGLPVIAVIIHKDEKHQYYDRNKKEMSSSRDHGHYMGACITKDGRCNCKDLINPEMCRKVQDLIQEMCLKEWGFSYQTGEGRRGRHKTVEQLKQESQIALQEKLARENVDVVFRMRQEKKELAKSIEELDEARKIKEEMVALQNTTIDKNEAKIADQHIIINDQEQAISDKEQQKHDLDIQINIKTRIIEKLNDALTNLVGRFKDTCIRLFELLGHWVDKDINTYEEIRKKMEAPLNKGKTAIRVLTDSSDRLVKGKLPEETDKTAIEKAHGELKEAMETLEEIEEEYNV